MKIFQSVSRNVAMDEEIKQHGETVARRCRYDGTFSYGDFCNKCNRKLARDRARGRQRGDKDLVSHLNCNFGWRMSAWMDASEEHSDMVEFTFANNNE